MTRETEWLGRRREADEERVSSAQLERRVNAQDTVTRRNDGDIKVIEVFQVVDGCRSIRLGPEGLASKCQ